MTYASIIKDSMSPYGKRIVTFEVELHRFVLAELNTHRMFSRNSASSRAIPVSKQINRLLTDPAIPLVFPAEQPGMQGGGEFTGAYRDNLVEQWLKARDQAIAAAQKLREFGVHKSVTNRLLEPFMWHKVIITTGMDGLQNFFDLRCSPLAQPEIRVAAEMMQACMEVSTPQPIGWDEWHLPYVADNGDDWDFAQDRCDGGAIPVDETLRQLSVARCCRVSYLTHDLRRDPQEDVNLYHKLIEANPMHASPMEHVATPEYRTKWTGNLPGWQQLRHIVEQRGGEWWSR